MSPLLVALLLLIIAYKLYQNYKDIPPNLPPCIPRLPIVGSYWHLLWRNYYFPAEAMQYYVNKLRSKIVTCYLGPYLAVVVNDYDTIKEVLSREEFDGRVNVVDLILARGYGSVLGIFFADGLFWQEQRRFLLRHARDRGFGRRHDQFERDMMDETEVLVNMLKEGPINENEKKYLKKGYALFPDVLYPYMSNSIFDIMFGVRYDRSEHHRPRYFSKVAMMFQRSGETTGGAIIQFSFLKYFGSLFGYKNFIKGNYLMADFIKVSCSFVPYFCHCKEFIDKRKLDSEDDSGVLDSYLKELKKSDKKTSFSDKQLIIGLVDFMFPAATATPTVITNAIKFALHNPQVQKKVQEEIDRVVGTGRLVTWSDRNNLLENRECYSLPYTEATIRETMRYETVTPFSVMHRATKKTTLRGYDVPCNTVLVTNLIGMNNDPDLWGDPENFRPERFLNEDGQLGKDNTLVFGFGHRVCAGETFARFNMFECFAALMQNFNFSLVEGEPTDKKDKFPGLIVSPKEAWVRVEPRFA